MYDQILCFLVTLLVDFNIDDWSLIDWSLIALSLIQCCENLIDLAFFALFSKGRDVYSKIGGETIKMGRAIIS
jgi:hypothetical protein